MRLAHIAQQCEGTETQLLLKAEFRRTTRSTRKLFALINNSTLGCARSPQKHCTGSEHLCVVVEALAPFNDRGVLHHGALWSFGVCCVAALLCLAAPGRGRMLVFLSTSLALAVCSPLARAPAGMLLVVVFTRIVVTTRVLVRLACLCNSCSSISSKRSSASLSLWS